MGLLTVVVGVAFFFTLPDSPLTAELLSYDEQALYFENLRGNEEGIGTNDFKKEQIWEALQDPNTWLYAFCVFTANIPDAITKSFGNILVTKIGLFSNR